MLVLLVSKANLTPKIAKNEVYKNGFRRELTLCLVSAVVQSTNKENNLLTNSALSTFGFFTLVFCSTKKYVDRLLTTKGNTVKTLNIRPHLSFDQPPGRTL